MLIGLFKNSGRVWCRKAKKVKDHDFRSEASGIVAPYVIYDVGLNAGVIVVGKSADTPEFAVNAQLNCVMWKCEVIFSEPLAPRANLEADQKKI